MPQGEPLQPSPEFAENPDTEYRARLAALHAQEAALHAGDRRYVGAKIGIFLVGALLAAWMMKFAPHALPLLGIVLAVFALVFVLHERVLRRLRVTRQRVRFYERGLARLEGRWAGAGRQGVEFLDEAHPYARDLDLFGKGGLFELLCTARTGAGEKKLAEWLLAPAAVNEVLERQAAVRELAPRLDFQEGMTLAGEDAETGATHTPESLIAWAEAAGSARAGGGLRAVLLALAFAWALCVLLWLLAGLGAVAAWHWGLAAIAFSVLNGAISGAQHTRVTAAAQAVDEAGHELPLLAAIFGAIEREQFTSPRLSELRSQMQAAGASPSHAVSRLNGFRENIRAGHNVLVKAVDFFVFWTQQWVWAADAWRARYGASVRVWLEAAAEIEALLALAVFAHERPEYVFPEFAAEGPCLVAEEIAHPLIAGRAVGNSIRLGKVAGETDEGLRLIVISGPNMAGKSTFTRSVGVNAVLAQAGAPVRARRMVLSRVQVAASICILDSLQGGLSRFYAEITRLKQIYDLTARDLPVLFLMDELLSGTNSHDRRVGTESVVRGLLQHGAFGIVTTHDLALTAIVDTLDGQAANYHFGDTFADGKLFFDYRLSPGIAYSTNALELMRSIGLAT